MIQLELPSSTAFLKRDFRANPFAGISVFMLLAE